MARLFSLRKVSRCKLSTHFENFFESKVQIQKSETDFEKIIELQIQNSNSHIQVDSGNRHHISTILN